jgi:transcriptional regulator with GAF, ATPase, and Fis domain
VQSKLLRVLESREVLALGASKARTVDVRFVLATHRELRAEVSAGSFRQDLYYRIARPEVSIPPLRERIEDVPWLVARALGELRAHVSFVEECMMRAWPGNVRELVAEVKQSVLRARAAGRDEVSARDLTDDAGHALDAEKKSSPPAPEPDDARIAEALAAEGGNVTRAAKVLGMHRTQLRRMIEKQKRK